MWLAPMALTVAGRAASEQTWIMFFPCSPLDYTTASRAGEGRKVCTALPSRGAIRPGDCIEPLRNRAQAMPDALAHPQPCMRMKKAYERSHHGHIGSPGIPRAMV